MRSKTLQIKFFLILIGLFSIHTNAAPLPTALISSKKLVRPLTVELATTRAQREHGLMFRKNLANDHGMLFVFPDQKMRAVWMKNTVISLDVLFLDQQGNIVNILYSLSPCAKEPCLVYQSQTEAKYMLELPAGFSKDHNFSIGDQLRLH